MSGLKLMKNSRFQNGCGVSILYNPVAKTERTSLTMEDTTQTGYDLISTPYSLDVNGLPNNGAIYCFGNQFGGYVDHYDDNAEKLFLQVTWGTFPEHGVNLGLSTYINNFDYLYIFDINGGDTGGAEISGINRIDNVKMMNYTHIVDRKTFGFNAQTYDVFDHYEATLLIPPEAPDYKLEQMMHSKQIVLLAENNIPITEDRPTGFAFDKPHGGGSLSPVVRSIMLKDGEIKYSFKREYKTINVQLLG